MIVCKAFKVHIIALDELFKLHVIVMCDGRSVKMFKLRLSLFVLYPIKRCFLLYNQKKRMASKINDGADNHLNDYQLPSGIGIKKGLHQLIQPYVL